ncbi:MAG: tetratricopeptide repeat protein [Burkholderiales bacterium]|nr:tetratricopeptide repeat protein [Bacteroidia bacterium]
MKSILLTLFLYFLPQLVFSQERAMDSLKRIINTTTSDTIKVNTQITICRSLWGKGKLDSAMIYAEAAKKLAESSGFKKGQADAYNNIGIVNMYKGDYYTSEDCFLKAAEIFKNLGNKKKIANMYNNLGEIGRLSGNYTKAIKMHYTALKIRDEINDSAGIAMSNNNIATIADKQGNFKKALANYFLALNYYKLKGTQLEVARTYGNISENYRFQKQFDKALEYQFVALDIRKTINDVFGLAMSYNNLGSIYNDIGQNAVISNDKQNADKYYTLALDNYLLAQKFILDIGDVYMIATNASNLGLIYKYQKKYKLAEKVLMDSYELSKKTGSKNAMLPTTEALALLYFESGEYKQAYLYKKIAAMYADTILGEESTKKTFEAQIQYNFDKKASITKAEQKQKDIVNEKEKQRQRLIIYAVVIGLIIVIVFSIFLYNRFQITNRQKKIIETKEQEAQKQNEIISQQKHIVEEKHKEITDSINYAERIQRALLANKTLLNAHLKDYFVLFKPKDVVSGDFYWATILPNKQFILTIADSTGHGVPGAIMSILNISCLDKAITEGITSPELILNETRRLIIENLKHDGSQEGGKDGMDGSLLRFDFENNMLDCACANSPVWIVRKNELGVNQLLEIKPDRMPIGKHEKDNISFTLHAVNLQKDDVVYAFTDGMPDQFGGPKGKKFMHKQLKELLIAIADKPMETQKQLLAEALNNWKGNLEQIDDVALVGVRI